MRKLYDTAPPAKRGFLVGIWDNKIDKLEAQSLLRELEGLCSTLGLVIAGQELVHVRERQPKFGMGSGKAEELSQKAKEVNADLLVFNYELSPSQQRNWEEVSGISALDRQELIIKIFAERAVTREAELQVKLAELEYMLPRLSHKYIDLSRQRGGRYGTRGAGETLLETDRRQVEKQIHKLKKDLEKVQKQRQLQRRQRERQALPICAIVGYTNAGKSSLLNALTGAGVLVEDKLFATLDATTRRIELFSSPSSSSSSVSSVSPCPPCEVLSKKSILLVDTVGFIRRLPHSLIKAFRSTLEEALLSDILIHVLDASDPDIDIFYQTTNLVLSELGAKDVPVITVLNKIDRIDDASLEGLMPRYPGSAVISVKDGRGLEDLKREIAKRI